MLMKYLIDSSCSFQLCNIGKIQTWHSLEAYSRPHQTSMIELYFAKIAIKSSVRLGSWSASLISSTSRKRDESKYSRMNQVKFFKDCLPQILLGPFLNTLPQMFVPLKMWIGMVRWMNNEI